MERFKFQPEHFPVGTVFTVDDSVCWPPGCQSVFRAVSVVRNGFDSYSVETDTPSFIPKLGNRQFHFGYIKDILSRGKGPVVVNHRWFGLQPPSKSLMDRTSEQEFVSWTHFGKGKGQYKTLSLLGTVQWLASCIAPAGTTIDWDRLLDALVAQSWVRRGDEMRGFFYIPKKKLRRWLKQNLNRFALRRVHAERELEAARQEEWEQIDDENPSLLAGSRPYRRARDFYEPKDFGNAPVELVTTIWPHEANLYRMAIKNSGLEGRLEVRTDEYGQTSLWFTLGECDLSTFWVELDKL